MHFYVSVILIVFTGWTISSNICVLLELNLKSLLLIAPVVVGTLIGAYSLLLKKKCQCLQSQNTISCRGWFKNNFLFTSSFIALICLPVILRQSWVAFWILSVSILILCLVRHNVKESLESSGIVINFSRFHNLVVVFIAIAAVVLSYTVNRSDLDDAFYVAAASFPSANPTHAIFSTDPMLGEPGFPLIFPSYRFASFELLSGAIAYLISKPAMDVYYIYLLPVWVFASVTVVFLLTKEMIPRHWLLAGIVALLFTLLLGEMHRSPANFSFVRIFQGKAVFLSVIVPAIFYLTTRFFSGKDTKANLFLLACCQIASVGMTNFGMLMGPIAGFGAFISNIPLALKGDLKKIWYFLCTLLLPLPYLIDVALKSSGSPIANLGTESAASVWTSVFGSHQQYLVGFLLLAGPVLAKDTVTRWRLTVPPLLLLAIYLNPWLAGFIGKYVTSPPVYWRVVWSFPILIFAAVSFCMIMLELFEKKSARFISAILSILTIILIFYSLPFNTLRFENIGPTGLLVTWCGFDVYRDQIHTK